MRNTNSKARILGYIGCIAAIVLSVLSPIFWLHGHEKAGILCGLAMWLVILFLLCCIILEKIKDLED